MMAAPANKTYNDYFDVCGAKIKKQNVEKTTIKSTTDAGINTAYGFQEVASTANGIYKWHLKIDHGGKGVLVIGISSYQDLDKAFYKNTNAPNYGYNLFSGNKVSCAKFGAYGKKAKTDDIVTTILDLNKGTVSYDFNGIKQPIAHNVKQNEYVKYRFCVSIQDNGDTVTLQNFEVIKPAQKQTKQQIELQEATPSEANKQRSKELEVQKKNADLMMEVTALTANAIQNKQTIINLEKENNDLQILSTQKTSALETSTQRISILEQKQNESVRKISVLEQENVELQTQTTQQISTLEVENNSLKDVINTMKEEQKRLKEKVDLLEDEKKGYEMEINELKEKVKELEIKAIDINKFMEWDEKDVLKWIFSLKNGLFMKYEQKLKHEILDGEIKGIDLLKINLKDIKGFGVKKFADQKVLEENIDRLRAVNDNEYHGNIGQYNNNDSDAQAAYVEGRNVLITGK